MTAVDLSPEASAQRRALASSKQLEEAILAIEVLDRASRVNKSHGGPRNLPAATTAKKARRAQRLARKRSR